MWDVLYTKIIRYDSEIQYIKDTTLKYLKYDLCNFLICWECADHCDEFIERNDPMELETKSELIERAFMFRNEVRVRLGKEEYTIQEFYDILLQKVNEYVKT